jgi:hypothetical protein
MLAAENGRGYWQCLVGSFYGPYDKSGLPPIVDRCGVVGRHSAPQHSTLSGDETLGSRINRRERAEVFFILQPSDSVFVREYNKLQTIVRRSPSR